ncbi:asparagine synthase C-terminal domain-containing protein [Streptantibioticus cattleyicolor]|uniref:Putative beta-lactam synthetase n=2 Tax=Streptantibioticus cattleyicolor TaxID=29303 RepID=F8JNE1_STREN|nr:asparagine synthase C-terminal domain-containing protein [Streptantibioticus cattleyicolor]AEW99096.1 putative beta-lactam synthetase [Streptantibioticus cattleyicolor NRRL 8057 = DSM 46488]CAD18981.1 putative beta-lactam synthetase [Streptantibioticus cattleyicolor]CCB71858.1 putative beta-lactam synthetase [Streptantibioticus cattleyicolor NRRL 8057 = DSM 46488]
MAGFLLRCRPEGAVPQHLGAGTGLATEVTRDGADVLVVHGDPLTPGGQAPIHAPLDELIAWTVRAYSRFCAVLVRDDRAVLWSDNGATCPLHYARGADDTLLVATSAGALLPLLGTAPVLGEGDRAVLPGGRFAGVTAVPAGTAVTLAVAGFDTEPLLTRRYHRLPARPTETDPERAVTAVRDALTHAVGRLATGLTEAGVMLSGGVDSSSVAALAAREVTSLSTYTVGTPFGDEFAQAAWFAERLGSKHHELVFEPEQLTALLPEMIRSLETWDLLTLQIAAPACFLLGHIATGARQVMLSGYGADLIFAGLGGTGTETRIERSVAAQTAATAVSNEFNPAYADARDVVVRYPYWTREVMSTALGIRGRLKVRPDTAKWVLRSAVTGILPDEVAWRPKRGIHEGTAMSRMFAAALGSDDRHTQARRLYEMATEVFRDTAAGTDELEGSDEGLAGVAS